MPFQQAVVDGFEGACGRVLRRPTPEGHSDPRPILWLLLDHVMLMAHGPAYLTLFLLDGKEVVRRFSSLANQDRAFWNLPELAAETPRDEDVVAERGSGHMRLVLTLRIPPTAAAKEFAREDVRSGARELLEMAGGRVFEAMAGLSCDHPDDHSARPSRVVTTAAWASQCDLIRRRLDPILMSYGHCEFFPSDEGGRARLFVVPRQPFTNPRHGDGVAVRRVSAPHQHVPATYGYTAGVFLTPTQREERSISEADMRLLEPLGAGARAIADTPLTSGIVDIGHPGERTHAGQWSREYYPADAGPEVKKVEDRIYGRHWRSESIFYVPIHIGGTPWLALFSFHDASLDRSALRWRRYRIYRDIVPTIAEEASHAVAQAFADALASEARAHLSYLADPGTFARRTTEAWADLACVFPYGRAALLVEGGSDIDRIELPLPGGQQCSFVLSIAAGQANVSYRLLDTKLTKSLLELQLRAAIDARRHERHTLGGLTLHEWVHQLADGITRVQALKEAVVQRGGDEALMDQLYGLYGSLQADIGLPWFQDDTSTATAPASPLLRDTDRRDVDLQFLKALFELHVRTILNSLSQPKGRTGQPSVAVLFRFHGGFEQGPSSTGTCIIEERTIRPGETGVARVGALIGEVLQERCPWPLAPEAIQELTLRESLLSALTLAPREMLRNALAYVSRSGVPGMVEFAVTVLPGGKGEELFTTTVRNRAPETPDEIDKHLAQMQVRCSEMQHAVPFVRCTAMHDSATSQLVAKCSVLLGVPRA